MANLHTVGLQEGSDTGTSGGHTPLGPPGGVLKPGDPVEWQNVPTYCFKPATLLSGTPDPNDMDKETWNVPMLAPECIQAILGKGPNDTVDVGDLFNNELNRITDFYEHYADPNVTKDGVQFFSDIMDQMKGVQFKDWQSKFTTIYDPHQGTIVQQIGSSPIGQTIGNVANLTGFLVNPENLIRVAAAGVGIFLVIKGGRQLV